MPKIALLIEYDGRDYHGFQVQNNVPTIQGELEKAILKVSGEAVRVYGAGRTDAGVHARGQVAAIETASALSVRTFLAALNHHLPSDIAIKDAQAVESNFDPRRDAISREYRYTILNDSTDSPLSRWWAYFLPRKLNVDEMNKACEILQGEHDFAAFTNNEGGEKNTVRIVSKAEVRRKNSFVFFDMIANAFLPQQVRRTVGSLLKVGTNAMKIEEFRSMAQSAEVGAAKYAAPPHGLCLIKVNYSDIRFVGYENI